RTHLVDIVQRVEDAEDVDAGVGGFLHEGIGDLGWVRRVADRVATAQQHLDRDVRQRLAELLESRPRILAEEPESDVVGRATPRLDAQQLRLEARDVRGDTEEVSRAYAGREERLMRVAEGRLRHRERLLLAQGR